jgi:hypothetical protein
MGKLEEGRKIVVSPPLNRIYRQLIKSFKHCGTQTCQPAKFVSSTACLLFAAAAAAIFVVPFRLRHQDSLRIWWNSTNLSSS